ncbi:MAG TPA: hypothetical protein VGF88_11370 [Acidobacteriaceae bacterium]|jgi:hypothetical protein
MKPVLPLRIASVLTFIHAVLHTAGGVFGKTPTGTATLVVATMKANPIHALGVTRTYFDYYHGMGLAVSIFLTAEAIVFWQLSTVAKSIGPGLRPIFATFFVGYLVFALDSYLYFFAAPVITEALISACFLWALIAAKPTAAV